MDWHVGSLLGGDAVTRALTCLATTLRGICPLIAFASVAASLGCRFGGSDLYAGDRMDTDGGLAGDAGGDGANGDGNASSIPDLNGSWAQRWTVASVDSLPVIGDVSASTTSIHRLSIEQHGLELLVRVQTCRIEINSGTDIIQEIIPDAFVASLGTAVRTSWLEKDGERYRFIQPRTYEIRGVRLIDAANEALPKSAEDPRVYDQDQDGRPGVTVRVTGLVDGEVWVVQRDSHEVEGLVAGPDQVEGTIRWSKEQAVLGADNPLLTSPLPSVPDPDPSRSRMEMVRLQDDLDCVEILADEASLFGAVGGGR